MYSLDNSASTYGKHSRPDRSCTPCRILFAFYHFRTRTYFEAHHIPSHQISFSTAAAQCGVLHIGTANIKPPSGTPLRSGSSTNTLSTMVLTDTYFSTLNSKERGYISISELHVQYSNGTCVRISPDSSATRETGIEETAFRFALERLWMYQISRSDMQLQM